MMIFSSEHGMPRGSRPGPSTAETKIWRPVVIRRQPVLVLFFLVACLAPAVDALPGADEILASAIAYHDPEGRFLTEPHRFFFRESRPEGAARKSIILIDVSGERFEMVQSGEAEVAGVLVPGHCEMTLDGSSQLTAEEGEKYPLSCERLRRTRDYYTFLWGLPMKLRDPGTRLGAVEESAFLGREVYGLRVSYDEKVGKDTWVIYFDRATSAMVGYRFYHDESKGDGEYIVLEGEIEGAGIRLPKSRTWYTHQGDRLLGTDTLLAFEAAHQE